MKKIYLTLLCLFVSTAVYAKITAEFVPSSVKQGGVVELVLSSDTAFSSLPNIEILKKDFVIGGQQTRQSAQWINGKGSSVYQLVYTLYPNKSGTIAVQGLKVGNEALPELKLTVGADAQYASKGEVALSVTCSDKAIYPAQKTVCQVHLNDSMGVVEGEVFPPQTETGTWEQVLPLFPVADAKNGVQQYQGVFAFTPKQSGHLNMPGFVFQGEVQLPTQKRQYNSMLDLMFLNIQSHATRPIEIRSKPFNLTVKEKPANYKGWWLPSSKVTLIESYKLPETIAVGDPISRTLVLSAKDVVADNMPVPEAPASEGVKVYSNPEQRHDTEYGGEVSVTLTFVPTKSGEVTLPAIQVPWFNTQTEKIETISVPEKTIFVSGTVLASDTQVKPVSQPSPKISSVDSEESKLEPEPIQEVPPKTEDSSFPWLLVTGIALVAFLLGLLIAIIVGRHISHSERKKKKPLPDLYPF